jgi:hypothetical protein
MTDCAQSRERQYSATISHGLHNDLLLYYVRSSVGVTIGVLIAAAHRYWAVGLNPKAPLKFMITLYFAVFAAESQVCVTNDRLFRPH